MARRAVQVGHGARVTRTFIAVVEAMGCIPAACHACGQALKVGEKMGVAPPKGLIIHWRCRGEPITLEHSAAESERVQKAIGALGGVAEIMREALDALAEGRESRKRVEPGPERGSFLTAGDFE